MTDSSGQVLNTYSYLPYGELRSASGSAANPFTFLGKFGASRDGGGLIDDGAREYAPALGRFTSRDPIPRLGTNPYTYSANDPVDLFDANGLDPASVSDTWFGGTYYSNAVKTINTTVGLYATSLQNAANAAGSTVALMGGLGQSAWENVKTDVTFFKSSVIQAGSFRNLTPFANTYAGAGRILNWTKPIGKAFQWLGAGTELTRPTTARTTTTWSDIREPRW